MLNSMASATTAVWEQFSLEGRNKKRTLQRTTFLKLLKRKHWFLLLLFGHIAGYHREVQHIPCQTTYPLICSLYSRYNASPLVQTIFMTISEFGVIWNYYIDNNHMHRHQNRSNMQSRRVHVIFFISNSLINVRIYNCHYLKPFVNISNI